MTFDHPAKSVLSVCAILLATSSPAFGQANRGARVANAQQPGQRQAAQPTAGPWGQLSPQLQAHTDKVLKFWEFHSDKIQRYRCEFKRWEYDQVFHAKEPQTVSAGRIMYAKPDKGLFEVTKLHQGRKMPDGTVKYTLQQQADLEKWICDGKTIFQFDHRNKRLNVQPLPPNLQGKQIVEGPLPFFFGAKMAQIKARYWVRVNPEVRDKFWIEAYPKRQEDLANFRRIDVVIPDTKEYLPKAIIMHHPGGSRTTFEFENRDSNWKDDPLKPLRIWEREFYNPKTPKGWQRIDQPLAQAPPPRQRSFAPPAQAQRVSRTAPTNR
ncbi:MAG: hypothetical protein CMJ64_19215 [Planctomycetaceae bacterium]|jgi:TIGR03009 family protein|nr:hypothetical protein [Planctomycetaceae bacterium]